MPSEKAQWLHEGLFMIGDGASWARRLKVRHLESFLVLDEAGTLTRAAERLHMTQSAMSHWLAELESVAGTPLVVRGRKVQLTPAGHLLKRLAVNVLGDISRTGREMQAVAQGRVPRLNVGSVWAGIAGGLPEAVSAFQRTHADVAVSIHDGPFDNLLKGLETRALDAVIGVLDARAHQPGLEHEVLFEDRVAIVVGQGSKHWAHSDALSFRDVLHEQWVMPPGGTLTRMQMDAFLIEQGASWLVPRAETGVAGNDAGPAAQRRLRGRVLGVDGRLPGLHRHVSQDQDRVEHPLRPDHRDVEPRACRGHAERLHRLPRGACARRNCNWLDDFSCPQALDIVGRQSSLREYRFVVLARRWPDRRHG
ncbi:LysR family transcriptional regulator [Alicycliphilus sp. B1]|nr:LysR family transcriptional regulator [Alicycliphilus sp. B1]